MLLSHMNLMKKLKINIQDSTNMKVQFDLRNVKDLSNISQAIKVLATTLKNIDFDVLVLENLSNTFSDTNNLKVIYNPLKECDYLITLSHDDLKLDNLISLKLLKAKDNVIYLGNLNNTKDSFEDILNKFKQSYLYKEEYTYALLNSYSLEGEEFNNNHKEDDKYKGIISPIDIVKVNPNLIISSYEVSNTFISSLLYTIEFLNKKNEKVKKEGYFSKIFNNFNGGSGVKEESINYLIEETNIYLGEEKIIFIIEEDKSYSYYYTLFYKICNIIKI